MESAPNAPLSATQIMGIDAPRKRNADQAGLREFLPFAYVAAGFSAFFATLYVPEWYWVVPYYFLGAIGVTHALSTFFARRRSTQTLE